MTGITLRPDGKYLCRLQHDGKRYVRTFATEREAIAFRTELLRIMSNDEPEVIDATSLRTLGPSFLKTIKGRDQVTPRNRWERHVSQAPFALRKVSKIHASDISDWLASTGLAWQSKKHLLNLLRRFYRWAILRRFADANPCEGLRIERTDRDSERGYQPGWYLSPAEQAELLANVEDVETQRMITVALYTGVRLGELLCLHRADVHGDHIVVRYGSWSAREQRYLPPKGAAGSNRVRTVQLFGPAREALVAALSEPPRRGSELVFPSRWGGRRTHPPKAFLDAAKRLCVARLGGEGRPWWHLLRHTCASALVAGWWGPRWALVDVQAHLGHTSITTTQRYAHHCPVVVSEAARATHEALQSGSKVDQEFFVERDSQGILAARPAGFEPTTFGFGGPGKLAFLREMSTLDPSEIQKRVERINLAIRAVADRDPRALRMLLDVAIEVRDELENAGEMGQNATLPFAGLAG